MARTKGKTRQKAVKMVEGEWFILLVKGGKDDIEEVSIERCRGLKPFVHQTLPPTTLIPHRERGWAPIGKDNYQVVHVFSEESEELLAVLQNLNLFAGADPGGHDSAFGEGLNRLVEDIFYSAREFETRVRRAVG